MNIRRLISILLVAVMVVGLLAGCGQSQSGTSQTSKVSTNGGSKKDNTRTKIRVAIVANTMGVPVAYAQSKGFYEEEGIDIDPIVFPSGPQVNEAFAANEIDVAVSGLASIFSLATGKASWIAEINTTQGLGIYIRPDSEIAKVKGQVDGFPDIYGSVDTMKGIKILGPLGNVAQYCAVNWVQRFGLTDQDVQIVNMDYGPAYQAFLNGEGDAVALNNPYSFEAEDKGYVCAATFEDATGTQLYDGMFANTQFIEKNRDAVVKFIKATYRAIDELQDDQVRFDFSKEWFAENGKNYEDEILRKEISLRKYIDKEFMLKDDFVFGHGMLQIADFYEEDGKIEPENVPNVGKAIDVSLINDALGIDVKSVN